MKYHLHSSLNFMTRSSEDLHIRPPTIHVTPHFTSRLRYLRHSTSCTTSAAYLRVYILQKARLVDALDFPLQLHFRKCVWNFLCHRPPRAPTRQGRFFTFERLTVPLSSCGVWRYTINLDTLIWLSGSSLVGWFLDRIKPFRLVSGSITDRDNQGKVAGDH